MAYQRGRYGLSADNVNAIWRQWKKHRDIGREICFDSLDAFIQWSAENGYDYGKELQLLDDMGPLSPENCQWVEAEISLETKKKNRKLEQQWNEFVAPIRLAAYRMGMNPCDYCPSQETCKTICPLRAVYWDVGMEKLRKELGA